MGKIFFLIFTASFLFSTAVFAEFYEVKIKDNLYEPANLTVKPGDTVRWVNAGDSQHTITSGSEGMPDGFFSSKSISKGDSFEYTFNFPGSYPYFCTQHYLFEMKGVIEVGE